MNGVGFQGTNALSLGWVGLNMVKTNGGEVGCGGGPRNTFTAELWIVLTGIQIVWNSGARKVTIESDTVINTLNNLKRNLRAGSQIDVGQKIDNGNAPRQYEAAMTEFDYLFASIIFQEARRGLEVMVENCSEVMSISRSQVGCLLLILLSISVLNHQVLGARHVKEEVEHVLNKSTAWRKSFTNETNGSSYATVNRVVPSSPDPLHNR
ncbi:hypothetical protein CR513_01855, partial [Mucuna pruriens]